jgi:hypothetical protein
MRPAAERCGCATSDSLSLDSAALRFGPQFLGARSVFEGNRFPFRLDTAELARMTMS